MHTDPVQKALRISLMVSSCSLVIKLSAYFYTNSTAALSDAVESVVHLFAVIFVVYGYYLSRKPADEDHHYGHERIEFLSVGAEGAIIILAGITIFYHAISNYLFGIDITNIHTGIYLLAIASLVNFILGRYLLRVGGEANNMIAISNGKHTLTDVWTSAGVVVSLILIHITGWTELDIIVSVLIALYIFYEAYKLLKYSVSGLMDARNPEVEEALKKVLQQEEGTLFCSWHHLRHRTSGYTTWIELHLAFDDEISLKQAHQQATELERKMIDALKTDAIITLHLEPEKAHQQAHDILKGANKKSLDEFA